MNLSWEFLSYVGCFGNGPPVFGIADAGLVTLIGISTSLTAFIAAVAALIKACLMVHVIHFLSIHLPCVRLLLLLLTPCNVTHIQGR